MTNERLPGKVLYESLGAISVPPSGTLSLRQKAGKMRCLARGRTHAATIVVLIHPYSRFAEQPGVPREL
jgi:hypothetical protein